MTLINTDRMVFIGPGSEWFWAALSGVVTMVTLLAIWRQLRLQASQTAIEQLENYDAKWESEALNCARLEILVALAAGVDPAHLSDAAVLPIVGFWEKMGALVRSRHIDAKLLWNATGRDCAVWWTTLAPYAQRQRSESRNTVVLEHFEWLAGTMNALDRRAGVMPVDHAWLAANMDRRIAMFRDLISAQRSLRSVIIASPEALTNTAAAPAMAPVAAEG